MCTVSFVRSGDKTIITSNRDEEVLRPAIAPKNYLINNKKIIFPKDPRAGGTWYAVDAQANVLVLLNGAAEKHLWNPPYRKSRGLIVLDLMGSDSPLQTWQTIDLDNIEPFTRWCYLKRADCINCVGMEFKKNPFHWTQTAITFGLQLHYIQKIFASKERNGSTNSSIQSLTSAQKKCLVFTVTPKLRTHAKRSCYQ